MSASKKYKSETATEVHRQQDTENLNANRFRKSADYFAGSNGGPSTSAAAASITAVSAAGGRIALIQQNTNSLATPTTTTTMQRTGSNTNLSNNNNSLCSSTGSANGGERLANFSMLDSVSHINDHRSSTTTSAYFNNVGNNNASKPGDVKKIVIKNFKGNFFSHFRLIKSITIKHFC